MANKTVPEIDDKVGAESLRGSSAGENKSNKLEDSELSDEDIETMIFKSYPEATD